jgi:hypothetical protein
VLGRDASPERGNARQIGRKQTTKATGVIKGFRLCKPEVAYLQGLQPRMQPRKPPDSHEWRPGRHDRRRSLRGDHMFRAPVPPGTGPLQREEERRSRRTRSGRRPAASCGKPWTGTSVTSGGSPPTGNIRWCWSSRAQSVVACSRARALRVATIRKAQRSTRPAIAPRFADRRLKRRSGDGHLGGKAGRLAGVTGRVAGNK